jgi:molybdopterin molybdotransferase
MPEPDIGLPEALKMISGHLRPLPAVTVPLDACDAGILAEDLAALVDSPSVDTSMKDGYALRAMDLTAADDGTFRLLTIAGRVAAGDSPSRFLQPGAALRILTGGALPHGADTIVAEEFTRVSGTNVRVTRPTGKGRNIRPQGSDTRAGEALLRAGRRLTPGDIGLLAAAGHAVVKVVPKPRVAIIATGDEVLLPGQAFAPGKLYASNLLMLNGWCRHFGMPTKLEVVGDQAAPLADRLQQASLEQDAIVTSGGAWTGDKDLMARVLENLGWQKHFHRLRLGPGKGAGFGFLNTKPVFILPGGPPSNLVAFLTLALPGLLQLGGQAPPGLPAIEANLAAPVSGNRNWTQAIFGDLQASGPSFIFLPHDRRGSRLQSMARAQGLLLIPEGLDGYRPDDVVPVQLLR